MDAKHWTWLGLVVILMTATWVMLADRRQSPGPSTESSSSNSSNNTTSSSSTGNSRSSVSVTTNGETTHVATTTLKPVSDETGLGTANRSYDGTTFTHSVAADLPKPDSSHFYEGWLVNPDTDEFVSTGKLIEQVDQYELEFSANKDLRAYSKVVVTREISAKELDNTPETHVLEGEFK